MNPPRIKWPSLGFVSICLVYASLVAFFMWGLHTPALERVWTYQHKLKIGQMKKMKYKDKMFFLETMAHYPTLAQALLQGKAIGILSANSEGWIETQPVTILRVAESEKVRFVLLDIQTPEDLIPFSMVIRGFGTPDSSGPRGWIEKLEVNRQGKLRVALPPPTQSPEIIQLSLKGRQFKADSSELGVHIQFAEEK